jgi:hypothetical protein
MSKYWIAGATYGWLSVWNCKSFGLHITGDLFTSLTFLISDSISYSSKRLIEYIEESLLED